MAVQPTLPVKIVAPPTAPDPALERVLARVRLRARRRAAWLRKLWSEEGAPGGSLAVTHAEIDTHLADRDDPAAEAAWFASEGAVAPLNRALAEVEEAIAADTTSHLARLGRIFGLSPQELDILHACLALALDPALARVYAYLQDHAGRGYATEALIARLFGHGRCCVWSPASPLRSWGLVIETPAAAGEPAILECDRPVRDWLLGQNTLDTLLVGCAALHAPATPLAGWPVDETAAQLAHALHSPQSQRVRVRVCGPPASGRRTLAACISARLGFPLLAIDGDAPAEDWREVFVRAQRQAYLSRYAPAWSGNNALQRPWPQAVPHFPLQFVICEPGQVLPPLTGVVDYLVEVPPLSLEERRGLWRRYLPATAAWPAADLEAVVAQHRVTVGEIAAVACKEVTGPAEAAALVRQAQRHRLGNLAKLLECPFTWQDLVVGDNLRQALEDLLFEAQKRVSFWERPAARRLFPQGRGLLGLFSGEPGTGKTMAAQVIAANLGVDLFRIDLATVVSKYVGETSQNLERILARAAQMDVVLLFDEADALFGKRTEIRDAHDRFANTDTGYLLQAIESYQGVAVLATNKKGNIDPAFIRRLRYVLEFPKPDAAQRLRIWRQIVAELAGPERRSDLGPAVEALAAGVEVTGAQIKFAILGGLFAAQRAGEPLAVRHLLRGLERELQKEGRALSSREKERFLGNGR